MLVLAAVACGPTPARADPPAWAARVALGQAFPGGDLSGDTYAVSDVFRWRTALRAGAGVVTWGGRLEVGASAMLGAAPENTSLSPDGWFEWGRASALLAEVAFHPIPRARLDPWLRLGAGVTSLEGWYDGGLHERWTGLVLPRIEIGAQVLEAGRLGVAPYVAFELGRFTRYASAGSYAIPNRALHYWGEVGIACTVGGR